jgi:hypothetical protein
MRKLKEKSTSLEKKIIDFMNKNNMSGSRIEVGGDMNIFMKDVGCVESISCDFLLKKEVSYFKDETMGCPIWERNNSCHNCEISGL